MYSIGSAMLPSTDAIASLRQTSRLRRQTGIQRSEKSGTAQMLVMLERLPCRGCAGSVAQLAPGQLDEQVLEVRRPVQVAYPIVARERVQERLRIARIAERGLAGDLDPVGDAAAERLAPGPRLVAVDL